MPNLPALPELNAAERAAWRRLNEALRRVNQDYAIFGDVERENARRLEDARRQMSAMGITWGVLRKLDPLGRPIEGVRAVPVRSIEIVL